MINKMRTCLHCKRVAEECRCIPGFSIADWRPASGASTYDVSATGQVRSWRSHPKPRTLKGCLLKSGSTSYPAVSVQPDTGPRVHRTVHALVAETFIGPRPQGMEVRHWNGDSMNPTVENLVYGSKSENEKDKLRHRTNPNANKTHCPRDHEYDEANTQISKHGKRQCLTCSRERRRAAYGHIPRRADGATHCPAGHEWTMSTNGGRKRCATCENAARRRPRRADLDTHCPKGHERNAKNTHTRSNGGGTQCRVCERDRQRAVRAAKADR